MRNGKQEMRNDNFKRTLSEISIFTFTTPLYHMPLNYLIFLNLHFY